MREPLKHIIKVILGLLLASMLILLGAGEFLKGIFPPLVVNFLLALVAIVLGGGIVLFAQWFYERDR